jgi:hypothetical protein
VIVKVFPNLFCLDVSFNDLCDMEAAISWCKQLTSLKMLYHEGNPLVFTNDYAKIVAERVVGIKVLDGHSVFLDQATIDSQEANKKSLIAASKASLKSGALSSASSNVETYLTGIKPNLTLDLHFRLLKNVEGGRYLIPEENCFLEVEKLDEIPEEQKSSMYWITFTDHNGAEIASEKRSYIKHF